MNPIHAMGRACVPAIAGGLRRTEGIAVWRGRPQHRAGRVRLPGRRHRPATPEVDPQVDTAALIEPSETSPQEVWWRLEDLWLRLAHHCSLRVEQDGSNHSLVVNDFRHVRGRELDELRSAVFDNASYHWQLANDHGSSVVLIAYRGDDLVFMLTPAPRIEAWPKGADLASMVQGFLAGLRLKQAPARRAAA